MSGDGRKLGFFLGGGYISHTHLCTYRTYIMKKNLFVPLGMMNAKHLCNLMM